MALAAALLAMVVAACGGASDEVGGDSDTPQAAGAAAARRSKLSLVAYAVPKVGFDKVIPAFNATPAGKGITFSQSYGASGDQSRKVESGLPTDIVQLQRRARRHAAREVRPGRRDLEPERAQGHPVRLGGHDRRPARAIRRASRPGTTCSSRASRSSPRTRSPRAARSGTCSRPTPRRATAARTRKAGLAYLSKLIGDHIKVQPKSGREATETFLQGTGDVLLSYENEALFAERNGEDVEHHTPDTTFKIENPVAVVNTSKHQEQAQAFVDFLYTPEGQKAWAEAGFRPVDATVAQEFAADFPEPEEAVDDRRPRRLEQGQRRALRAGHGLRGQDLRRGDLLAAWPRSRSRGARARRRAPAAASGPSASASPRCG